MPQDIDYGTLMHTAMRGLIQKVLTNVAENGLPGAHHFFITFDTRQEGVELADWLHDRYPEEMTIVMQHWFENLEVGNEGFAITLNFGDAPEPLYIPYTAIKTFVDPSVEFGLRFESSEDEDETATHIVEETIEVEETPVQHDADVVSLDSFRK
ncbi:SspB family protein [Ruegeria arenilitoris]|uniref:SspB family protein n=1 Tax=Ruegeria arenilitoris TaxID=1173585 RepID=UPI00147FD177|nr:ClpXP protease specificity-enhancing factor SspB [Ruegeria arenilitoris]